MADQSGKTDEGKAKRGAVLRSPSYPSLDIKAAIERARQFYNSEKRASANVKVAAEHWGYQFSSSGGKQAIAALLAYGLMEDEGSGENRKVRLTDLALRIILDERPDSKDRDEAIKRAALTPKIHQEILNKWAELPSDSNLRHYLVLERKFNENTVADFIRQLRATVLFAKLHGGDIMSPAVERKEETPQSDEAGDGKTPESAQLTIQGSSPVIATSQFHAESRAQAGEREWLRGPLTKETSYRLIVSGDIGSKELGKLIKLLEAQKLVLDEDDD